MLTVQDYLLFHTYEELEKEYGIKANVYDDRVVLNYSQIDSPKHEGIVQECRALILSRPDHKVLSRTFDRFFNYGEDPNTKDFDIEHCTIDEKIDGSICPVYHDGDKWQVATRSMAFAEGETFNGRTFREVFIEALGGDPNDVFKDQPKNYTIIFELVSPETRVVKPYEKTIPYLLEVRDRDTGHYLGRKMTQDWDIPDEAKWNYPQTFQFKTWDECLKAVKELPTMDEGYVAVERKHWRIKIKNPAYLAVANLRMNGVLSEKRVSLLVLMNDHEEYLNYFSEDQKLFDPYIKAYEDLILDVKTQWEKYKDMENQKEFALAIKDCPAKNILFAMRNKGQKINDIIDNMFDNAKVRLLSDYRKEIPMV